MPVKSTDFVLPPQLRTIHEAEYPRFSAAEMARRRAAIERLIAEAELDHLVYCGANRFGSAVQWLTGWPVTTEAVGRAVARPAGCDVRAARQSCAAGASLGGAGGRSPGAAAPRSRPPSAYCRSAARVMARSASIGPMTFEQHAMLAAKFGAVANLNRAYTRLRQIKSAEELDWMRIGAAMTDRGMIALRDGLRPGLSERDLRRSRRNNSYIALGGTNVIHFIGVTPMAAPALGVPTQFVANRKVARGDFVFAEISAAFWEHPGQVLRSFAVGEEPTALYQDPARSSRRCGAFAAVAAVSLKAGALPQQVIDAAHVIEDAGFTIIDDLLHGYGGGYLPPILGSRSRPSAHVPDEPFRAGMVVVIQPNVVTLDGKAGVQTGEMVLITDTGIEPMHAVPRGLVQI